jgi:hypothetical protein
MRHDLQDVNPFGVVMNCRHEPVFVAPNVEDRDRSTTSYLYQISRGVGPSDVLDVFPQSLFNNTIPAFQRRPGLWVDLPKLLKPRLCDDPHRPSLQEIPYSVDDKCQQPNCSSEYLEETAVTLEGATPRHLLQFLSGGTVEEDEQVARAVLDSLGDMDRLAQWIKPLLHAES